MQKSLTIALIGITLSCITHPPIFGSYESKNSHSGSADESGEEEKSRVKQKKAATKKVSAKTVDLKEVKAKSKTKTTSPAAVPRSTAGSLSAPTKATGKNSARLVEVRDVEIEIPEELKRTTSAPAKAGLKKAAAKQSKNSQEETDEDEAKGFTTTPVTTKAKSRTGSKAKTAASYESANEQSDEESAAPSSEQRSIIVRSRSEMKSSGAIPGASAEKLKLLIKAIPHVAFAPTILPCLLKLISEEQELIEGACFEFDDMVLAQAWANASKMRKIGGELVVDRHQLKGKKKSDMRKAIALLLKNEIGVYQNIQRYTKKAYGNNDYSESIYHNTDIPKSTKAKFPDLDFFETMHQKFFIFSRNEIHGPLLVTGSFN